MNNVNIIPFKRYEEIVTIDNFLNDDEIDLIHTHAFSLPVHDASVFAADSALPEYKPEKRISKVAWIHPTEDMAWLFDKVFNALISANNDLFHLDIDGAESLQYTTYEPPGGNYGVHKDAARGSVVRKLSFTIQLTDPETYSGGDFKIYDIDTVNPFIMKKDKGCMTIFLSSLLHEVTPVIEGTRQSLVGWASGPALK